MSYHGKIPNGSKGYKWLVHEIAYLASLNHGYGFRAFSKKLWPSNNGRDVLTFALAEYKEMTGRDLYEWLQDPIHMKTVYPTRNRNSNHRSSPTAQSYHKLSSFKVCELDFDWGGLDPNGYNWRQ